MKLYDRKIWDAQTLGKESIGKDNCPFCIDTDLLTIWKGQYWHIRKNKYPYNGLINHLLLIPNRHTELTKDLTKNEFNEMKSAESFLYDYYKGLNYFSLIRQTNGGKSIKHLHYHYLPGKLYSSDLEKILK